MVFLFSAEPGFSWTNSTKGKIFHDTSTFPSIHDLYCTHLQAMNNLVNAELAFCEELTVGIETYIEPLRSILSEATHSSMFLGLSDVSRALLLNTHT